MFPNISKQIPILPTQSFPIFPGAGLCRIMQDHVGLCRIMQDYAGLCRTMQDYGGVCRAADLRFSPGQPSDGHSSDCRVCQTECAHVTTERTQRLQFVANRLQTVRSIGADPIRSESQQRRRRRAELRLEPRSTRSRLHQERVAPETEQTLSAPLRAKAH